MAWQTSKRVWDNVPSSITKNDRLVLLALAECADEFGVCWPGYDRLADMVGVDPRSAMRLVQRLETQKQIIILRQSGKSGGRGYTNLYLVTTGLSQDDIKKTLETHPKFSDKGDTIYTLLSGEKGDNFSKKGDKKGEKGDKKGEKGDIAMSPEPLEPSLEPSSKPIGATPPPSSPKTIPAVKVFVEVTGKYCLNNTQMDELKEVVGDTPIALEKWRNVVKAWRLRNYSITNISGMLDWFRDGIPVYRNGQKGQPDDGQKSTKQPEPIDDSLRRFAGRST